MSLNENLPSPCVSICKLNKLTGFCEGCFRTENEIAFCPMNNDERFLYYLYLGKDKAQKKS